jgi:hypothetical protein
LDRSTRNKQVGQSFVIQTNSAPVIAFQSQTAGPQGDLQLLSRKKVFDFELAAAT